MKRNSMIKSILAIVLVIAMLFAFAACGNSATDDSSANSDSSDASADNSAKDDAGKDSSSGDAEYTITLATAHAEDTYGERCFRDVFIPRVEELTDGRVAVDWYPNYTLGNESDLLAQTQMNTVNITVITEQSASLDEGRINALFLPYLFENLDQCEAVMSDEEITGDIFQALPDAGLTYMGALLNGVCCMTNNIQPIETLDDVAGIKMRVSNSDMLINIWTKLGANPIAMNSSELYTALETGTVDGQDNSYPSVCSMNLQEVLQYFSPSNHIIKAWYVVANQDWLNGLPDVYAKLL